MLGPKGILFVGVVMGFCLVGIVIRLRFFPYLALLLILLIFILNLHVLIIFQPDWRGNALWSLIRYSGGNSLQLLYAFIAKIFFNAGVVIVPFMIFLLAGQFSAQPRRPDSEW